MKEILKCPTIKQSCKPDGWPAGRPMEYKFNTDQIELIKDLLINQENIWLEDKKHYQLDLKLLNECQKIITERKNENR